MMPLHEEWKKKNPPLLLTRVINSFEKSCSTFRRRGRKNPLLSTTLCQFAHIKIKIIIIIIIISKPTMTMGWILV
jgi:hypothetical protein